MKQLFAALIFALLVFAAYSGDAPKAAEKVAECLHHLH